MTAPRPETSNPVHPWTHLLMIAGVCLAVYANAFNGPFVFDDITNIRHNPYMRVEGFDLPGFMTAAFESRSPRPVANLSFAINHAVCGFEEPCYRAVNVLIHAANGLLVYSLGVLLFLRLRPGDERSARNLSLLAALVFVTHPIQVQSVTYVVQRMTSMATLFYLAALLLWLRGRLQPEPRDRRAWWAGTAAFWVLAFGSKQIAATLPLAILLVEWIFFQDARFDWLRGRAARFAALLALIAALGVGYLALLGFPGYEDRDFTMGQRLLTQLRVVPFYLGLLLLPLPGRLSLIHHFAPSTSLVAPLSTLFGGSFLLALAVFGVLAGRREKLLSFAILWFFLNLLLESSVLPLEMAYEHRLYLPMVALSFLVADSVRRLTRARDLVTAGVGALLVVALGIASHSRNEVWSDAVTLWYDAAAKSPLDGRPHAHLASLLHERGRPDEAARHLDAVLAAIPGHADAHHTYGMLEEWVGRFERAREKYQEAVRLDPDEPLYRMKVGLLRARTGDIAGGVRTLEQLTRDDPEYARGFFALGVALELGDEPALAQAPYLETLRIDPDHSAAHVRRAAHLSTEREFALAAHHLREALRLDPHNELLEALAGQAEAAAAERR